MRLHGLFVDILGDGLNCLFAIGPHLGRRLLDDRHRHLDDVRIVFDVVHVVILLEDAALLQLPVPGCHGVAFQHHLRFDDVVVVAVVAVVVGEQQTGLADAQQRHQLRQQRLL